MEHHEHRSWVKVVVVTFPNTTIPVLSCCGCGFLCASQSGSGSHLSADLSPPTLASLLQPSLVTTHPSAPLCACIKSLQAHLHFHLLCLYIRSLYHIRSAVPMPPYRYLVKDPGFWPFRRPQQMLICDQRPFQYRDQAYESPGTFFFGQERLNKYNASGNRTDANVAMVKVSSNSKANNDKSKSSNSKSNVATKNDANNNDKSNTANNTGNGDITFTADEDAQLLELKGENSSWKAISTAIGKPVHALKARFKELNKDNAENDNADEPKKKDEKGNKSAMKKENKKGKKGKQDRDEESEGEEKEQVYATVKKVKLERELVADNHFDDDAVSLERGSFVCKWD
ncbi:hypothetical protein K402DRAFT_203757 [Aulographum hederae CBS 113979]|uniref:Myb-like domain-containing protein n=1 Tax=Aulographum hederae CBS 113979 TaxID=1176131 RepID=A0A6G1HCQ5_9PEZI|nr:hypothetical protein K402DRAFT_203757 [Aulographum hederae CBS 113979]